MEFTTGTALRGRIDGPHSLANPKQPLEIQRAIHGFDLCIACAVHVVDPDGEELTVANNCLDHIFCGEQCSLEVIEGRNAKSSIALAQSRSVCGVLGPLPRIGGIRDESCDRRSDRPNRHSPRGRAAQD